jgi:hypothetical protein
MKPRATAAERSLDLSAMRELANLTARTAIDTHHRRQTALRDVGKVIVTVAAVVTAGVLFWFHLLGHGTAFYGAMVCLVVAASWGLRYALAKHRLRRERGATKRTDGSLARQVDQTTEQ